MWQPACCEAGELEPGPDGAAQHGGHRPVRLRPQPADRARPSLPAPPRTRITRGLRQRHREAELRLGRLERLEQLFGQLRGSGPGGAEQTGERERVQRAAGGAAALPD